MTLDQAISEATKAEATLNADTNSLTNINTAIATASAPLPAAQQLVANDTVAFNSAMDDLSAAAQASKLPVPAAPPAAPAS